MDRPKGFFREGRGTQSILIRNHNQLKIKVLTNKSQVFKHAIYKPQFAERVNLLVLGLCDERTITVYKQYFLLFHHFFYLSKDIQNRQYRSKMPLRIE